MPVCCTKRDADMDAYVWRIDESLDLLYKLAALSDAEVETYSAFRAESRKRQWLAVRACINSVIGRKVNIHYDSIGRPLLTDDSLKCISISHADSYVAVVFSKNQHIGIDIESMGRNYKKVASRYVSAGEQAMFEQHSVPESHYLPLAWCAKEAAFKALLLEDIDFVEDMQIVLLENSDEDLWSQGSLQVRYLPLQAIGTFCFAEMEDHFLVWGKYENI